MKANIIRLITKIKTFVRQNKNEVLVLLFILAVGVFCRFYKIGDYMTFLGDEGRDVIVVRRIFAELHPPLIGPGTSIGNMYLGPLYYYMMAPALLLANFSPIGPAVQIAILGIITIAFVWWVGRLWFGKTAGLIAAGLYAISPTVIIYSRSSWNPNIMPFFALLAIYSIWKVWRERKFGWLAVLGISFAFVLQSHYIGLLLIPTLGLFWLVTYLNIRFGKENKTEIPMFIKNSLFGLGIFAVLMSPLFLFDMRHGWINFSAMKTFFTVRQETVSIRPWSSIPKIPQVFNLVSSSVVAAKNKTAAPVASFIVLTSVMWFLGVKFLRNKGQKIEPEFWLLSSWLVFSLIGFGLYKQNIYDHYFGFIFAVPFLFIGVLISRLFKAGKFLKIIGAVLLIYLVAVNLAGNPLRKEPNKLLARTIKVSQVIENESGGKPFNLAVIAETNYEDAYQYFLLKDGLSVIDIDAQIPETITDQLFVVCELIPTDKCDPTHSPKAQVANFGWSKIDAQWEVNGVIIYRLLHTK